MKTSFSTDITLKYKNIYMYIQRIIKYLTFRLCFDFFNIKKNIIYKRYLIFKSKSKYKNTKMFISQTFDFIVFITLIIELIVLMINLSRCIKIIEDQ